MTDRPAHDDLPRFEPLLDERPLDTRWPELAWPMHPATALTGRFVTLTLATPADVEELFTALDHEAVWAHVAGRPSGAGALAAAIAARGPLWATWVVRLACPLEGLPAGTVVGTTSYLDVSPADARLEVGSTLYSPTFWGGPVNPEAKLLLLGHAFDRLGAGRVQLKTDVRNIRSQQAIARLGARYEGTLRRYQRRADGTVRDTVLFSIAAEDWPSVQARLQARLQAWLQARPQTLPQARLSASRD